MPTTLRDVALRAGVSIKTASNVVRGHPNVKNDIRRRVQAAIEDLQYRPNFSARYLRTGQVGVLSLVIPDLHRSYFAQLAEAIIHFAEQQAYTVLLDHSHGKQETEKSIINGLRPHLTDGMIIYSTRLTDEDLTQRHNKLPLVILGDHRLHSPYDHISINYEAAAILAIQHLLAQGRQHIAIISTQQHTHNSQEKMPETLSPSLRGYKKSLLDHRLSLRPEFIVEVAGDKPLDGYLAARQLLALAQRPDALFCDNDPLALGAMRAILELGLHIPEDIALIGVENSPDGLFSTPSLSSIAPDIQYMAELAVSLLLKRIHQTHSNSPACQEVPLQLLPRESTPGHKTLSYLSN